MDLLVHVADGVLVDFFGIDWVQSKIVAGRAGQFIRPNPKLGLDTSRHADRVVSLAEMLFNFQNVPGLEAVVERIATNSYETGLAELEAGKFLAMCRRPFHFNLPTGKLGESYDLSAWAPDGTRWACDSKCKIETTMPSSATVANAVSGARDQLPNDCLGVVFLKIPEGWFSATDLGITMQKGLAQAFAKTRRIGVVVVHWERWEPLGSEMSRRRVKYRVEINRRARFLSAEIPDLLETKGMPDTWCDFHKLVDFPAFSSH